MIIIIGENNVTLFQFTYFRFIAVWSIPLKRITNQFEINVYIFLARRSDIIAILSTTLYHVDDSGHSRRDFRFTRRLKRILYLKP